MDLLIIISLIVFGYLMLSDNSLNNQLKDLQPIHYIGILIFAVFLCSMNKMEGLHHHDDITWGDAVNHRKCPIYKDDGTINAIPDDHLDRINIIGSYSQGDEITHGQEQDVDCKDGYHYDGESPTISCPGNDDPRFIIWRKDLALIL